MATGTGDGGKSSTAPKWTDIRFVVAMVITFLFTWSYTLPFVKVPFLVDKIGPDFHDMLVSFQGNMQTAFVAAWSYYLGNSSSASQAREQTGQALDLATGASPPPPPAKVEVINTPEKPVPVSDPLPPADPPHFMDRSLP